MKSILTIIFLLFYVVIKAQSIAASPGWSVSVPANTITEAGSDYSANATSAINQTLVSLTMPGGVFGANFTVSVHKIDTDWHSNLSLWVQRTGTGTGNGLFSASITGGASFLQLTSSPQTFYTGTTGFLGSTRNNVPIQYEIRGISVLIPVKTYSTTVVYTISN
ncbi:MAG: hypothetical protein JNL70_04015 [Saprospiraceae bacterium]|nr:hypothetical protein [Saprospiraceae bacterium]